MKVALQGHLVQIVMWKSRRKHALWTRFRSSLLEDDVASTINVAETHSRKSPQCVTIHGVYMASKQSALPGDLNTANRRP